MVVVGRQACRQGTIGWVAGRQIGMGIGWLRGKGSNQPKHPTSLNCKRHWLGRHLLCGLNGDFGNGYGSEGRLGVATSGEGRWGTPTGR